MAGVFREDALNAVVTELLDGRDETRAQCLRFRASKRLGRLDACIATVHKPCDDTCMDEQDGDDGDDERVRSPGCQCGSRPLHMSDHVAVPNL
ncbi:MAG: hypothetical protein U0Q55_04090 [Vicinamibacterales bacterium]